MGQPSGIRTASLKTPVMTRIGAWLELFKMRLLLLVVVSSALGYAIAPGAFDWVVFTSLLIGGTLVTGSSNAFNQIIERDTDRLMKRTLSRPLPEGRMPMGEALAVATLSGLAGILLLWYLVNPLTSVLAGLALFVYVVLYTPLKKVSRIAVFVGAFPGAIPPMLGWVAATGRFDMVAGLLFAIQFIWQFPHFWAIAWITNDDYRTGGFDLLPSASGKGRLSAFIIVVYNVLLIPISLVPAMLGYMGSIGAVVTLMAGVLFLIPAIQLLTTMEDRHARRLMFASFIYLPIILLMFILDKI